jgi:hypothetical protein
VNFNKVIFNQAKLNETKTSQANLNKVKSKQVKIKHQKHFKIRKTEQAFEMRQIKTFSIIKLIIKLNNNDHVFLINLKHVSVDDFMFNSINLNHLTNIYVFSLPEILAEYQNLIEVFFKTNTDKLPLHHSHIDHHISLKEEFKSVYNSIYNLSEMELSVLKKYLKKNLNKEFIHSFMSF